MNSSGQLQAVKAAALLVILAAVLSVTGCGGAPAPSLKDPSMTPCPDVSAEQTLSIDDVLQARDVYEMGFSPDASALAWVQIAVFADSQAPEFALQLTSLPSLETRQLFDAGYHAIEDLSWSPDGKSVEFLTSAPPPGSTSEDAATQVWSAEVEGGDVSPLTAVPGGVSGFDWRGPGSLIYRAVGDADAQEDIGNEAADKDDTVHVSQLATEPERLYELDVTSGDVVRLTDNDDTIPHFSVSPDGNWVFMVRTMSAHDDLTDEYYQDIPFENYLLDLRSGEERRVCEDVRSSPGSAWSDDSSTLYLADKYSQDDLLVTYVVQARALDLKTGEESVIPLEWERGIHLADGQSTLRPVPDGFIVSLAGGFNPTLARYTVSNGEWTSGALEGEHQGNIFSCELSPDGRFISYVYSTASMPPRFCVAELAGDEIVNPREIVINPHLEAKSFTPSEVISWGGANGDVVEGMLFYPAGYSPGERYPLMLMLHGGPFSVDLDKYATDYQYPYQYMAQRGCFVLAPNYHGSRDYGMEFARSLKGGSAFYDLPLEDITKGIDRLVELGMVDPERLGTMGWSDGSILSVALIARDGRFKAASCGAGGGEWVSVWGGSASGYALLEYYFGVSPVEDPSFYADPHNAPLYDAAEIETPVVMYQGEDDTTVPPAMSWITYRGIQAHAQAPVELFIFPGEGHEPGQVAHWRRKMVEDQEWFDKYFWILD